MYPSKIGEIGHFVNVPLSLLGIKKELFQNFFLLTKI